jgi:hypothetical protein
MWLKVEPPAGWILSWFKLSLGTISLILVLNISSLPSKSSLSLGNSIPKGKPK